jgi:hypothetical protein
LTPGEIIERREVAGPVRSGSRGLILTSGARDMFFLDSSVQMIHNVSLVEPRAV